MRRLRYRVRIPYKELKGLSDELQSEPSLNSKINRPPKSTNPNTIVEVRVDVKVQGSGHQRLVEQMIAAHDGSTVGEPDPIGEDSKWVRFCEYFSSNWLTMVASYAMIVGGVAIYDRATILAGTFPYAVVLSAAIPVALASGLTRLKIPKIDFS